MGIDSSEIDEVPTSSTKNFTNMLKQRPAGSGANLSSNASGTSSGAAVGLGAPGGGTGGGGSGSGAAGGLVLPSLGSSGDHRLGGGGASSGLASSSGGAGVSCPTPGTSGNSAKKEEKKGMSFKFPSLFFLNTLQSYNCTPKFYL